MPEIGTYYYDYGEGVVEVSKSTDGELLCDAKLRGTEVRFTHPVMYIPQSGCLI